MILRSASAPILNSWFHHSRNSSLDTEAAHHALKPCSTAPSGSSSSLSMTGDDSSKKMTRALSESDLRDLSMTKKKPFGKTLHGFSEVAEESEVIGFNGFKTKSLSCALLSGLDEGCETGAGAGAGAGADRVVAVLVGGGVGGSGGGIHGGGGSDGGDDGGSIFGDSDHGNESTDSYYQKMIEENPGNSMLLSNYARFLKEVRRDYVKAEEYCSRAILSNPGDGSVLSMYADLIWETQKDSPRAESYFDQAVKAAPDDCYVLASYARFLWDAEEDEEEVGGESFSKTPSTSFLQGIHPPPPLAAAS